MFFFYKKEKYFFFITFIFTNHDLSLSLKKRLQTGTISEAFLWTIEAFHLNN